MKNNKTVVRIKNSFGQERQFEFNTHGEAMEYVAGIRKQIGIVTTLKEYMIGLNGSPSMAVYEEKIKATD